LLQKVAGCGYVESHETEVPFTRLPKFHISDHKEFLKSDGVEVWLVFSFMWLFTMCEGVAFHQVTLKDYKA